MSYQVEYISTQEELEPDVNDETADPEQSNYAEDILHHKCPVIKLVRQQIEDIGGDPNHGGQFGSSTGLFGGVQNKRNFILTIILLLLLIWFVFMYGAFTGASICGGSPIKNKACAGSRTNTLSLISGLLSTEKVQNVY